MLHYKVLAFLEQHPDLSKITHFDFFDSEPDLSQTDACGLWLKSLEEMAKNADSPTAVSLASLKQEYLNDKKNGRMRKYWNRRVLEQGVEKSKSEATIQAAITVNRTSARVLRSAGKQARIRLKKINDSVVSEDEDERRQNISRTSQGPVSTAGSSSNKKRKRPTMDGRSTSTNTEDSQEMLQSRKQRFAAMDPTRFWKLRSGRTVEKVLYASSLMMSANFKMRSYTIDFACERTRAVFTDDEWEEIEELNVFQLPKLPESTEQYLRDVRKAVVKGRHVASVPVPEEDRYSCELILRAFLSWTQLYVSRPCPFGNKDLSESFWCREAWPIMKVLLSDVDGLTMIDGEKAGLGSGKRKNLGRKVDMETPAPRKQPGRKVDLVARDTTNNRDWFIVESLKEWDEVSTKFLRELDVILFKDLHLIASHRLQEKPNARFHEKARFFSIYSGGRGFKTMEMRACPHSPYIMLLHLYDSHVLPSTSGTWKKQAQGLTHLLQVRASASATVNMYEMCSSKMIEMNGEDKDDDSDGEWAVRVVVRNACFRRDSW